MPNRFLANLIVGAILLDSIGNSMGQSWIFIYLEADGQLLMLNAETGTTPVTLFRAIHFKSRHSIYEKNTVGTYRQNIKKKITRENKITDHGN